MTQRLAAAMLLLAVVANAQADWASSLRASIERFLGKPYVWGAAGDKSFDCSGFVWRVAFDQGLFVKRTTARKLWFSTAPASGDQKGKFGNLIFFDDLRHIGIVNDPGSFYHAQVSKGTNLSVMTPHWRSLVGGEHLFFTPARPLGDK